MKYLLLAIILLAPVSAYSTNYLDDYRLIIEDSAIFECARYAYENNSRRVILKLEIDVGRTSSETYGWCLNGNANALPYERRMWFNNFGSVTDPDAFSRSNSNFNNWVKTFDSKDPLRFGVDTLFGEDEVNYKLQKLPNPTNNAAAYLQYNIPRQYDINKDEAFFYYAIGNSEAFRGEIAYFDTLSGLFASKSTFDTLGLGYPPEDLSNPSVINNQGALVGGSRVVRSNSLDVHARSEMSKAFFAPSSTLNYYYYPYYIEKVTYQVTGYDASNAVTYTKTGVINPTSNEHIIPFDWMQGQGINDYPMYDSAFDFGTKLDYDSTVATLPESVVRFDLDVNTFFKKNYLYRHRSPVDATFTYFNISSSISPSCNGLSTNLCTQPLSKGFVLSWNPIHNVSSGTSTVPITNSTQRDEPVNNYGNSGINEDRDINDPSLSEEGVPTVGGNVFTDWARDPNSGGGLEGQRLYAEGIIRVESKGSFFTGLQTIMNIVFEIIVTVFMICLLVIIIWSFLLLIPSAYRKFLKEVGVLGNMRFNK